MRNRLINTPDNALITAIRQLQSDLAALKQRQRTSGQSGVLGFTTESVNTWDLTGNGWHRQRYRLQLDHYQRDLRGRRLSGHRLRQRLL